MDKMKFLSILLIILTIIGSLFLGVILSRNKGVDKENLAESNWSVNDPRECQVKSGKRIVRGSSLSPLIENGQTIEALFGYYDCNKLQRDDVVLYSYAGNEAPLIKIIRGVPGDGFKLKQTKQGVWHILINDNILKTSSNNPYLISGKSYEMLALYERDYKNKIPKGMYLLLGNISSGGMDSTRFGLIGKNNVLAKVLY